MRPEPDRKHVGPGDGGDLYCSCPVSVLIFYFFKSGTFMRAHWRQWQAFRWALVTCAVLCLGVSIYYADLLKAAFARNPVPRTAESIGRGRLLFQQQCAICHGERGLGDGPVAASLRDKPEDLSKIARPPIFPDGIVIYRIANGKKLMPAFKTTLSESQLWDLLNFIRSLRRS